MAIKYSQVLKLFQQGHGTPVRTKKETHPSRILFCVPYIPDAPLISQPLPTASRSAIVRASDLSGIPMASRNGPIHAPGIVFYNHAENNGKGIWQSIPTDGQSVLIFNQADQMQFQQMQACIADWQRHHNGRLDIDALDHILKYAEQIGLNDRYNTTRQAVEENFYSPALSNQTLLTMPLKKPSRTKAILATDLEWDAYDGQVTETYSTSFLIVTNAPGQAATTLRHLNVSDAVGKYQLENGGDIILDPIGINIAVAEISLE